MKGFIQMSLLLAILWVGEVAAFSDNPSVVRRCLDSSECRALADKTPDYRYEAQVVEVIDADTIVLKVHLWPGMEATYSARIRGVDAPSIGGRASCEAERSAARRAKRSVERKYPVGAWVYVTDLEPGKFGTRVLADIERWRTDRFIKLSDELLANKSWGRPYSGVGPRHDWCS